MRFLLLTQYFPPEVGAPQVRLLALAQQLQKHGHAVRVVTAMPNYPSGVVEAGYRGRISIQDEVEGIAVRRTWIFAASGRGPRRMLSYLSFCITSLFACLGGPRPDHILVESPPLFLVATAWLASVVRRAPYVMIVSDLWPESVRELGIIGDGAAYSFSRWLEMFAYRRAWRIAGVTERICESIAARVESTKVTFLPNGVDTDSFQSTPSGDQPVLHEGEVGFVYAGTHGYAQGLDVIIEAARLTTDRRDIVYVFIGDGPEKLRLKELASGMQNVRFVEPRPAAAMPSVFSEMRASIVPLRDLPVFRGARPSKIFPSLACGTPVIYSGEGEAADLITSNDCGIAVPPENPEELAGAVRLLADDSAMAARLGAAGRRLVVRDYTWSSITERWLAELEATPTPAATR